MSRRAVADPQGILGQIVSAKRAELAARYAGVTLDGLRARAAPTLRSLAGAIARGGARFILEVKKASPSAGQIRSNADAAGIASGYSGVADALSVLADTAFFGGSLDDVARARRAFDGPILAKDFFIDLRQVSEARIAGADAILVMLSVLGDAEARAMIAEAKRLRMDALVEVHDEAEIRRALALDAPLIGINNRDLRDLSIDLATTEKLAPLAPGRLLVSESGIGSRADVDRLAGQVDGFLVGSSLMRASSPAQAARHLVFGRTKLCGLNSAGDIRAARPASFAGFVFAPGTPRHVTATQAAPLAGVARGSGMLPVGVFRNAPVSTVGDIATLLNLHAVQLHGREDREYVRALRRELSRDCEIWTALSVAREPLIDRGGDRLLFDNGAGGTGRKFDWSLLKGHADLGRALIAGGIDPANARAARSLGGYAIDVGSAVDLRPGVKSPRLIAHLFEALRAPGRGEVRQCA